VKRNAVMRGLQARAETARAGMWGCLGLCGCVWLCVAVCGCVWLCVAVCGCVWLWGL
jgi:hypothetical protein